METHKLRQYVFIHPSLLSSPSLIHPIVVSTDTRPYICKDDPQCRYDTNDPALLLRHRKKQHNYQPSRRKPGNSSASQALSPPLPSSGTSTSGVEVPMPNFFPVAGTSSHLPPMQPSLHYQEGPSFSGNPPPWDGIGFWAAEPQMNGSYGCQWSGPADPTPTMHGNESDMQINYRDATEFQDSRINHGSTSSYTLPSYYSPPDVAFPSQFFDNSADQSHYYTSGDYFDPCLWDFASGGRQNF